MKLTRHPLIHFALGLFLLWSGEAIALNSDTDADGDVDGRDLATFAFQAAEQGVTGSELAALAALYGITIPADPVATVSVREKNGQNVTQVPLTFGHVFSQGDVPQTIAVSVNGELLPTQCDIKRHYADGSVRHAVISVILPQLAAHQDLTLSLFPVAHHPAGARLSKNDLLATDIQSMIRLSSLQGSGYEGSLSADLRNSLAGQPSISYWLQGPVCTEIIVVGKLNNSLNAVWEARLYPGTPYGFRISNTIENVEASYRGNISYAVDIDYGLAAPQTVYHKDTCEHYHSSRWRKVLWQGTAPPAVEVHFDIDYLIASGHVPAYDTQLSIADTAIQNKYTSWLSSSHDIMDPSIIQTYFPTTGDRDEIGILPAWTALYLLTMDNRMRAIMLNLGELAGGIPIHMRESEATRSFFGHVVSIDDRPTVILDRPDFQYTQPEDRLPDALGETATPWHVDRAHQTSFAYIPYLITGEYYFLQEMYFWAGWDLGACSYNSDWGRNYSLGLLRDQVRGEAWALRVIAEAAALSLDSDPEKAYFDEKLFNNIAQWTVETVENTAAHPLHIWGQVSCWGEDGGRPTDSIIGCENPPRTGKGSGVNEDIYPIRHTALPWQEDFMIIALKHFCDLGYPAQDILTWLGAFTINRFTHPDTNPYNGAAYKLPATYGLDVSHTTPFYDVASWFQANQAMLDQPTAFSSGQYPFSYAYKARAALACLVPRPNAMATRNWLDSQLDNQHLLAENPTWALVPVMEN